MPPKSNLKIYCDGGARGNPGPAASAFVVINGLGKEIFSGGEYLGEATNNQAEYCAVLKALEWLVSSEFVDQNLTFYLDSLLVASQLKGLYKIKDRYLLEYYLHIKGLIENKHIQVLDYIHIPRTLSQRT